MLPIGFMLPPVPTAAGPPSGGFMPSYLRYAGFLLSLIG